MKATGWQELAMRTKRSVSRFIVQAMVAGTLTTGLAVVAPDTYFDMRNPATSRTEVVVDSTITTPGVTPNTYFDM
ncbi:MAG TPA: hypothetical protein VEK80_06060 [Kribbellaceae bacterium]|nr:hypothetical protein [Kribbellaceae bacterium]